MFENMTYEYILKRVLDRVSSDVDKRQGSVIYDAVAPACAELAQIYIALENTLAAGFADTAPREYLILRARERGLEPYEATYSLCKGVFNMDIPIGTKFSIDKINFIAERKIGEHEYEMRCETAGEEGNMHLGRLIAVDYINGLTEAMLTEVIVPARDEEDTESLRKRYFDSIDNIAFNGNKADYVKWVKSIEGVGQVRVDRAYEGGGNVRLVVLNAKNEPADGALLEKIKETLDPEENEGMGMGIAPIGHRVSVTTAARQTFRVAINVTLKSGYTISGIKASFQKVIEDYFSEANKNWESGNIPIYSAQILIRLLDISGVENILSVKVNGADYLVVSSYMIAALGSLEVI